MLDATLRPGAHGNMKRKKKLHNRSDGSKQEKKKKDMYFPALQNKSKIKCDTNNICTNSSISVCVYGTHWGKKCTSEEDSERERGKNEEAAVLLTMSYHGHSDLQLTDTQFASSPPT